MVDYNCQHANHERGQPICQTIPGSGIDRAVGDLLLEMVQPVTLELAFAVQAELQARLQEMDQLRRQQVERARYEAELARNRFMQVDPNNRLVAGALEADWNDKLRVLTETQENYEQQRQKDRIVLDEASRQKVLALAQDLPRLWQHPGTSDQDRKRIVRLLIEDVTLIKAREITVHIRFKGGVTRTLTLPAPLTAWEERTTSPKVIHQIDQLLNTYTAAGVAAELNRRGCRSGMKLEFTQRIVGKLRRNYGLKCRYDRLRGKGFHTAAEMAAELGVSQTTIGIWYAHGLLKGYEYNDKGQRLYELPPEELRPKKQPGQCGRLSQRRGYTPFLSHEANEVHHGT